jgi:NADPH:quinone reductase-like Zn-dependent oxidoreductase
MKQVVITKAGLPEVLQVREREDPHPRPGEVRVVVEAAGVNFADIMARLGIYADAPPLPCVVGYEVAGKIDEIGADVAGFNVGADVVALTRFNGYSDLICVPSEQCFLRPAGMNAHDGAAIPVNYLTAYQLMIAMGSLKAGETVLVHSAGGGVGVAAIQLAKYLGAEIIGTASARKHEALREMGVEQLIDYRTEDFERRVLEMTEGRGVELILDAVGGKSFKKGMRILAPTGRLGMFGMSAAATGKKRSWISLIKTLLNMPLLEFNPGALINNNKGVFGVNMGHMWSEVHLLAQWTDVLLDLYTQGVIKPHIDRVFSFEQAADAHHYIQDRKNFGKVLLVPEH